MKRQALVIVDAQRGFMPAEEGALLEVEGFGELPVAGSEVVIPALNELTDMAWKARMEVMTTQDWHPEQTAHFSEQPNFVDTWPPHCRAETPGAELHPQLLVETESRGPVYRFHKGMEAARTPAEDTSYTGALGREVETGELLPDMLRRLMITGVYIGGLAIGDGLEHPLCVDSTAIDLHRQGFEVHVVTDATEAVLPENRAKCFKNLGDMGIKLMTVTEAREAMAENFWSI